MFEIKVVIVIANMSMLVTSLSDAGYQSYQALPCSLCEDKNRELDKVKQELVKVLVESKDNNDKLKMELKTANNVIEEKKKILNRAEDEITRIKSDIKTKTEQVKQKDKTNESLRLKLENSSKEKDTIKENFNNKVRNLEDKNKTLTVKIEQMKDKTKSMKNKNTQTETYHVEKNTTNTQTEKEPAPSVTDASTETIFTKIELPSDVEHYVTCLCKNVMSQLQFSIETSS